MSENKTEWEITSGNAAWEIYAPLTQPRADGKTRVRVCRLLRNDEMSLEHAERIVACVNACAGVSTKELTDGETPAEILASRLISAWVTERGQIPWDKAVKIIAIVTKQSDAERDRLLALGASP